MATQNQETPPVKVESSTENNQPAQAGVNGGPQGPGNRPPHAKGRFNWKNKLNNPNVSYI